MMHHPFHLTWLLLEPIIIFVFSAVMRGVIDWTMSSDRWWAFPLYMALMVTLGTAALAAVMGLGAFAILGALK